VSLELIWEPIRLGPLTVPNRIARAANTTTISQAGVDEQFIAYPYRTCADSTHDSGILHRGIDRLCSQSGEGIESIYGN
jgi:2,4-dienoyl-CoA reductase-like NADH-dependent reductase (Old Yellow Enzyme family)